VSGNRVEEWNQSFSTIFSLQVFTAAPPLAMGLFDKVCSAETHLAHPGLYATKSNGESFFNIKVGTFLCSDESMIFFQPCMPSQEREKKMKRLYLCRHQGILDMDRERADPLVAALLATVDGPETRRSLGERQRRRLSSIRKLRLYCEFHATSGILCNSV
jgi:hypothetical protein